MLKKNMLLLIVFGVLSSLFSYSQVCQGTLGAPIVNINFGVGFNNPGPDLPATVPGATTSYFFQPNATGASPANVVLDGQYALLNRIPNNPAWHNGPTSLDNTAGANGYMAFFNAAVTPGEFYRQTVTGLCQGTTYQFEAFIANAVNPIQLPSAVLPDVTFNILNGSTSALIATRSTGPIPMQGVLTWVRESLLFTVPSGVTSVILTLTNNSPGGNQQPGNDLAIDDISFRPCGPITTASFSSSAPLDILTICEGSRATLYGNIGGGLNTPTYQWQFSSDNGTTWLDIPGATTLVFDMPPLPIGNHQFRLLSAESGNINTVTCRFISNSIFLDVIVCPPVCADSCFWKVNGNNITGSNNIFGTLTNSDIRVFSNSTQRGSILANGFFGWGTNNPTTKTHLNALSPDPQTPSGLRFENLPFGAGFTLVIDENGYVYKVRPRFLPIESSSQIEQLIAKNESLEREINALKAMIQPLASNGTSIREITNTSSNKLHQNKPNPFNGSTVIEYSIAGTTTNAYLIIYDLTGKEKLRFTANSGKGKVTINADQLVNGMYLYSLIINGTEIETKKMILSK
ncbi:MAG: T9SS type A sorting domain-containing protein [Chitinophagaceae bacterium]|nr:T9SS type A sorting domain-containing protein [Chitinophagaceae bacterium]